MSSGFPTRLQAISVVQRSLLSSALISANQQHIPTAPIHSHANYLTYLLQELIGTRDLAQFCNFDLNLALLAGR